MNWFRPFGIRKGWSIIRAYLFDFSFFVLGYSFAQLGESPTAGSPWGNNIYKLSIAILSNTKDKEETKGGREVVALTISGLGKDAGKVIDKWAAYVERLEKNIKQLGIVIEDLNDALQLANNERLACEKTLAKLKIKDHNLMQLYNELLLELQKLKGNKKNGQDSIVRQ